MTKMIKMSLIAAVAVTGMTSTVCAQPLEDAIKGVDVSGQLRYRYDNKQSNLTTKAATVTNEYTMKIATKSKVNEMVTANVQVEATGVNADATASAYESAHATTDATGDRDVNLAVTKANFSANLGFATVVAGKQSVPSPFVDNSVDDSTRGTGAVALIPVAGMTVAAGHFVNYSHVAETASTPVANSGKAIDAAALIGSVAGVSFDAWYVNVQDTAKATSLGLKTTIAGITLDARTSSNNPDGSTAAAKLNKLVVSGKAGSVEMAAGIVTTNKATGSSNKITLDGDNDAQADFKLYQASVGALSDATAYYAGLGMEVMPNVKAELKYVTVDFGTGSESAAEKYAGLTYAMSKNFSVHTRYSNYVVKSTTGEKSTDADRGRLEIKYTF